MNDILSEKQYQHEIMDYLRSYNGYRIRKATDFDRYYAVDRALLFEFLDFAVGVAVATFAELDFEVLIFDFLVDGFEFAVVAHVVLLFLVTTFNKTLNEKYSDNIFSVMEEVWASDDERVDLVIFLNGFAIMSFELKCNAAGQSYQNAILQYRKSRDPKTRLFRFKAGCIVNFAMDLQEVYMTTKLEKDATVFLPFNMGCGEGVDSGAGNPIFKDKYSTSYMWEDILTKDTILDLISKFIFVERKERIDEMTGKTVSEEITENIFSRFCVGK